MEKQKKFLKSNLDHEEKELLASFEKNEWQSLKEIGKEKTRARKTAENTLKPKKIE